MEIRQSEIEMPKNIFKSLYFQVLVGILVGGLIGYFYPALGKNLKPLGDGFVKMVKMIISPVIFITIASGIGRMNSLKGFGKTTIFAFSYFFIFSTLALLLGIFVANAFSPGTGMNAVLSPIDSQKVAEYSQKAHAFTTTEFLLDIIPKSFLSAFVDGNILQTLFVAVIFGVALVVSGEKGKPIVDLLDNIAQPMFRMVDILMHFAPIGAFGAIAFTVGMFGIDSIKRLLFLIGSFYFTAAFFVLVILGAVGKLTGFSIFRLINYLKSEILLVLGTSSSEAALPSLMEKLEGAGCKRETVGLVVPSGYSFNLDGTNIYLTLAALFIAQATNTHLTAAQQIALFSVAIVSSKGAAGVTGAGLITLAATLQVVPTVPLAGMALIVGVDRFMSECRAITNFIGNAVATIVVSKLQGELDYSKLDFAMKTGKPMYQGAPFTQTLSLTSGVKIGEKDSD